MEFTEFIICVEEQLHIQIPDCELIYIDKVQDLLCCIQKNKNMFKN